MDSIAIGNLKGGVGKSTVTVNLAVALVAALRKKKSRARVRILDMDPQAWATAWMTGREPREIKATVATMLTGLTTPEETVLRLEDLDWLPEDAREAWRGIDLIPSNPDAKLTVQGAADYWGLREALEDPDFPGENVAWTLFDCPYGQTDSFFLAVVAADNVLGVTSASEAGMLGMKELRHQLTRMARSFPHVGDVLGVVANNFDLRKGPDKAILSDLREQLGDKLWDPMLPSRVAVERSNGARLPLAAMPDEGSRDMTGLYSQLAKHLITTEAKQR